MSTEPIRDAIIVEEAGDALGSVAGVPLLVRTILTLQRTGIERLTLTGGLPVPADPRIRCTLERAPALVPTQDGALRLIVGSTSVIDAALVADLQARARPGQVIEVAAGPAWVRVAPGPRVARNGTAARPPLVGTLALAGSPGLEQALLRGLENHRDGYLDRLLHRRLSRPLTRLLLRTPLSPNAVTVIGIVVGVVGGWLISAPGWGAVVAGLGLLVVSGVLDCSDGELARLKFSESRFGHGLDVTGDTLVHVALLAGIARRLARAGNAPGWPALAALLVGVVGAFAAITWSDQTETRRHRARAWENRLLDNILSPLTTRDWYLLVVPFALAGRLDWLVPAAAVGAQVFWATVLVLVWRVLKRAPAH
jgi:phosphatidylglycerophosphate synthase